MATPIQPKLPKKHRKHGRNGRAGKHRLNQPCGLKNCMELLASRKYSEELKAYIGR